MSQPGKSIIRSSAFFLKEISEVLRQPRTIITLIFGPFIILFLFGVGYRNEPRAVRTIFVMDPENALAAQIQENAASISPQLIYDGITNDRGLALDRLREGQIDLVVVVPEDAAEMIQNSEHPIFELYHNEVDPSQVGYIEFFGQTLIEEVNRRVLLSMVKQGQGEAGDLQQEVSAAKDQAATMKQALLAGDFNKAQSSQINLRSRLSAISVAIGLNMGLLGGLDQNTSGNPEDPASSILDALNQVENNPGTAKDLEAGKADYTEEISQIEEIEADLDQLEQNLDVFKGISPEVLVRPYQSKSIGVSPISVTPLNFFAPGVIVLLLQHIAVTIGALSVVRERRSGTFELFRVSPISAAEILIGKYLSYLFFGILLAGILTALLIFGIKVPMIGYWPNYVIVSVLVVFASLGIGLMISILSETDSQAVQSAMIVLLLSVFFSGFILDLRYFWDTVKVVSWMLPSTYGTLLLQDIMLRGIPGNLVYYAGLGGIGGLLVMVNWWLMRYRMRHE